MKKRLFCAVLALILCFLLPAAALAFNSYSLDVEALKALEQEDTFPVRITRKTVTDNITGDSLYDNDALSFEIVNESDKTLAEVVIAGVAYDADGITHNIYGGGGYVIYTMGGKSARQLLNFTFAPNAAPGTGFTVSSFCDHSRFTGLRAIVKQYTASDGTVVVNPLYEEWEELALGSPTHILD